MKRLVLAILILATLRLLAANGDITGVSVRSDGWSADVYIAGLNTNGSYSFGLGTRNALTGTEKLRIELTSQGYDTSGTMTTRSRVVVGTAKVRKTYPNEAAGDEALDAGVLRVRVSLSDFVSVSDSNLVATLSSGLYTQGGTNSASSVSVTVTNSSTLAYPRVIANWAWPNYDLIRSSSWPLRVVGFHASAREGKPLASVKFIAWDAHSHTNTVWVTIPTIDSSVGDAVPVVEYVANMDFSTFTDGDLVTANFIAYPWIGNLSSIVDTSDGWAGVDSPYYHKQVLVLNKSGAHSKAVAVVRSGGNDSTGVVVTNGLNTGSPPAAFLTIAGAAAAIKATNNLTSGGANNTCSGGTIYLEQGSWAYTSVPGDTQSSYLWICSYPTNTVQSAITSGPGSSRTGALLCFSNITLSGSAAFPFYNHKGYWSAKCILDSSSGSFLDRGLMYFTGCTVSNWQQGFVAAEAAHEPAHIVRGNRMPGKWANGTGIAQHVVLGNHYTAAGSFSGSAFKTDVSGAKYFEDLGVHAFNRWHNVASSGGSTFSFFATSQVLTNGFAIIQNVFEQTGSAGPSFGFASDGATGATTNLLLWNNTMSGYWNNIAYNDAGSTLYQRVYISEKNNIYTGRHTKTDTFTTANSNRVGNWSVMWSVGQSGNYDLQTTNVSASGSFVREFAGIGSFNPALTGTANPLGSEQTATNHMRYVLDGGAPAGGSGSGNYRLLSTSPAIWTDREVLLPYDLEGNARGRSDPPGAFSTANPRKAGGFFQ